MFNKFNLLFMSSLFISLAASGTPQEVYHSGSNTAGKISVAIVDRTSGQSLPVYFYKGKNYIVGSPNHEYQINIFNNNYPVMGRKLVVVSVDGVNVITGQTASYQQSGYVVDQSSNVEIKGWRKNMNDIAKFYFTYPDNSYAARTDRPDNTGVIGIAVFDEKPLPPPSIELSQSRESSFGGLADSNGVSAKSSEAVANRAAPAAAPVQQKSELGTGHGRREYSSAVTTEFERMSNYPSDKILFYYDTYEHLVSLGIIPNQVRPVRPSAFPNEPGFAPDPR